MKKLALSLTFSGLALASFFAFTHSAEAAGLRAYYPLDADVDDYSGNGSDLTVNGGSFGASFTAPGLFADSEHSGWFRDSFGTSAYYETECSIIDMDYNDVFSISGWFNSTTTSQNGYVIGSNCGVRGQIHVGFLNDAGYAFSAWTGSGAHYLTSSVTADGADHFFVVTGDGTNLRLYMDGELVDTDTQDQYTTSGADSFIMGSGTENWRNFLDDIAIWDDTLQESEVEELWNSGDGCLADECVGGGGAIGGSDGFSFVNFEPSLQGRTLQDFDYYSVRYSSPIDANALPLWLRVEISTSSIFASYADNVQVNVWTYGGLQNLPKDALENAAYYYRITLSTSTDSEATWIGRTTGTFTINSSSTDSINCTSGGANPACSNGTSTDVLASTTTDAAIDALNCSQYPFITEYDAVLFTFPFFATSSPQRGGCEVLSVAYKTGEILIVPGKVIDGRGAVVSALEEFQYDLPFVIYFSSVNAVRDGITSGTSTTPVSLGFLYPETYNDSMLDPETMSTYTVLSTTTLTDFLQQSQYCDATCANELKETLFDWIRVIIWTGTALIAVAIII